MKLKEIQWFDKYFDRFYNDEEVCNILGIDYREEGIQGLNALCGYDEEKHVCWLIAKNEYYEVLSSDGNDVLELIEDISGKVFLGLACGHCLYNVDDEVKEAVGYESGT